MNYKSYLVEQNINLLKNNFTLFYGENLGLINEFKEKIKNNNKNAEIINLMQEDIIKNEDNFYSEILNVSLFDQKKVYYINQSNDKILNLIQKIEPKIDNQKIYFFSAILDKRSKLRNYFEKSKNMDVIACYLDNEISIRKIVQNKLKGFDGLSPQNLNLIVDNSNLDRLKLNNELGKIKTFFENKKITNDKLEELLDTKNNLDFNLLRDSALVGNKIKTNRLLNYTILDKDKTVFYLTLINQRLNQLNEIFKLPKNINLDDVCSKIKPPIFWKDKPDFMEQAKKWDKNKIKNILISTYNLEIEIKSNASVEKNILMKKLVVDICNIANA